TALNVKSENRPEAGERRDDQEKDDENGRQPRAVQRVLERLQSGSPASDRSPIGRQGFRQERQRRDEVRERQGGGEKGWRLISPLAQKPAERRAEDEPEPERRTDHPHPLRSVLSRRRSGDEGLRRRDVCAGHSSQTS